MGRSAALPCPDSLAAQQRRLRTVAMGCAGRLWKAGPMDELNGGRLLARCRMFGTVPAVFDLANGYRANYSEHLNRIERLCSVIRHLGLGPQDRLAVMAAPSHVYLELWRAAFAGAMVLNPLNSRLAPDEIVYILNDSGSEVVFVDAANAAVIAALRDRVPTLQTVVLIGEGAPESEWDLRMGALMEAASADGLPPEPEPDAACVLMYTGGTTGLPKGVVLSQAAAVLAIHRVQMAYGFEPGQRFLATLPMFHVGSLLAWGAFLPTGGLTVVQPAFEPGAVNAAIRDHEITVIAAVPTMVAMLLDHPDFDADQLSSLELVSYGGAPMPPELLERSMSLLPRLTFVQGYGMTECSAYVTLLSAADHERGGDVLKSVGRVMPGCLIEARDPESGVAVPQGEVGELYVRSGSMLTEYWNQPEATAEAVVEGWYRTGDAGRIDAEGYVFLADRVKDMIVSGGENVYSLEVENAISSHPLVIQVAVVGVPDAKWGELVHAVVVCDPDAVTTEELDAHARRTIAGYKVPRSWTIRTDPLPLSAAGKVLKRALRDEVASS